MKSDLFLSECVEGPPRLLKIRLHKDAPVNDLIAQLQVLLEANLREREANVIIDMSAMPYPANNFIAFLVANTYRARSMKGDLVLENLAHSARDNLMTFSALNYLGLNAGAFGAQGDLVEEQPASPEGAFEVAAFAEIAEPELVQKLSLEPKPASVPQTLPSNFALDVETRSFSTRAESTPERLYHLCDFVVGHAKQAGMRDKEIGKIRIAVYEACLNVIEHAYHSKPDNWIDLTVEYSNDRFVIMIMDTGLSSDLKPAQDYDVQEAVNERRTGGFGLHIIRRAVNKVEYHPDEIHGNRLVMIKNLN